MTGRVGISARYRIPDPLDLWRRALDWVSALYSMIGKFLLFNRQRSPQCLHHTLNEFSALMRQQVPEPCWDQRVARRRTLHDPCLSPVRLQRRELASRSSGGAQWLAARLTNSPITPNQISMLSVGWAALGSALLSWNPGWPAFIAAAVCVQQRLLCNLLDGMVAIEGGKSSATGTLFNEVPDRLSDALFLVPLGYPAGYPWLGWLAALLAVLTAFVRVLGGALGQPQNFGGSCQSSGGWPF